MREVHAPVGLPGLPHRAGQPRQNPRGELPGSGMAKACARALQAFCSLREYFVLLCQGLALARYSIDGPFHGATLVSSKDLSILAAAALKGAGLSLHVS